MNTSTAEIGAQIAEQRDRITETVSTLAESGAAELRDTAQDERGRKGLLIGAVAAFVALVLVRRLLG